MSCFYHASSGCVSSAVGNEDTYFAKPDNAGVPPIAKLTMMQKAGSFLPSLYEGHPNDSWKLWLGLYSSLV